MQRSEQTTCRNLVRASGGRPHAAHESSPVDARAHVRFCPSLPVSPRPRRVLCCPSEHPKGANSAASPVPASRVASHASGPSISQRITATPIVDRAATPTSAREKRTLCTPPAESATALPHIQIPAESATACPPSYKCGKNGNHLAAHSDSGKNGTPHRHLREFRQNRQPHRGLQRNRQPRIMGAQSNVRIPAESATAAPKNRNSGRIGNRRAKKSKFRQNRQLFSLPPAAPPVPRSPLSPCENLVFRQNRQPPLPSPRTERATHRGVACSHAEAGRGQGEARGEIPIPCRDRASQRLCSQCVSRHITTARESPRYARFLRAT